MSGFRPTGFYCWVVLADRNTMALEPRKSVCSQHNTGWLAGSDPFAFWAPPQFSLSVRHCSCFKKYFLAFPKCAEDRCHQNTASDLNTFTDTFPDNMRMKFVMTLTRCCVLNTSKSGDDLISMKETCGLCEGRAEQHYYFPVRAI